MNTGARQPDWFRSPFFRFWAAGSVVALVYVPLVTILYRQNPLSVSVFFFFNFSLLFHVDFYANGFSERER